MLINFCIKNLVTKISSDQVSLNGHEVENLISSVESTRKKGFVVENFVRPPVWVTVEFLCAVDVRRVVVGLRVGGQRSSGVEVAVGAGAARKRVGSALPAPGAAQVRLEAGKPEGLGPPGSLLGVTAIGFKVFRTEGSSLPCIGTLQVWGFPSARVPPEKKRIVRLLWKNYREAAQSRPDTKRKSGKTAPPPDEDSSLPPAEATPEEFLDPISYELMTVPMTLPCGKVVDLSTLEKFYKEEERWGRVKSDPFTGKAFSETERPVVAQALKTRIDKFLLDNSDSPGFKNVPRTSGKRPGGPGPSSEPKKVRESASPQPPCRNVRKASSVDELLNYTLEGLPSFLERTPEKNTVNDCCKCQQRYMLYKLPCEHLLCRTCLLSLRTDRACPKCLSAFTSDRPVRFHDTNSVLT